MDLPEPQRGPGELPVRGLTGCALGVGGAPATAASEAVDRRLVGMVVGGLIVAAWLALAVIGASPYARLFDHDGEILPFTGAWILMCVAMMLPTSLPFLAAFRTVTRRRAGRGTLAALLTAGDLATWTAFGVGAYLADRVLHQAVEVAGPGAAWPGLIWPATLAVAGLYQFLPLKYACLRQCRSPVGFLIRHWRGGSPRRGAFVLGVHHGLLCVGCCWALMLVMFGVGSINLAWMLALSAVMFVEKAVPGGYRIGRPLGVGLLALATAAVLV